MRFAMRSIASLVATALIGVTMPLAPAHAGVIGTEDAVAAEALRIDRDSLRGILDREDVRAQLQSMGVDPTAAQARVATMTDDEIAQVRGHLQDLPAGGSDVLGTLFLVFIILLVTDILGLTKVFPFTRSIR